MRNNTNIVIHWENFKNAEEAFADLFKNQAVSLSERGLLQTIYFFYENGDEFSIEHVCEMSRDDTDSVERTLVSLEKKGFITRTIQQEPFLYLIILNF